MKLFSKILVITGIIHCTTNPMFNSETIFGATALFGSIGGLGWFYSSQKAHGILEKKNQLRQEQCNKYDEKLINSCCKSIIPCDYNNPGHSMIPHPSIMCNPPTASIKKKVTIVEQTVEKEEDIESHITKIWLGADDENIKNSFKNKLNKLNKAQFNNTYDYNTFMEAYHTTQAFAAENAINKTSEGIALNNQLAWYEKINNISKELLFLSVTSGIYGTLLLAHNK